MTFPHKTSFPLLLVLCATLLSSCAIVDDLPLPWVKSEIVSLELSGQCDATGTAFAPAVIDKEQRTVDVYVDDRVDLQSLWIKKMEVTNDATVSVEGTDISFKPGSGMSAILDFTRPQHFVLQTYQRYRWTVRAHQVIVRRVELENQVGEAVIDTVNRNVIAYVSPTQDLAHVRVKHLQLGGLHGTTTPAAEGQELDFRFSQTFKVGYAYKTGTETWRVYVYNAQQNLSATASVFAHATRAFVSGAMQNGSTPVVEYREKDATNWTTLPASAVKQSNTSYEAEIDGLTPDTPYECRVQAGGTTSDIQHFTTAPALQLENAGLDTWHIEGSGKQALYCPWAEGGSMFWDTGNHGATTVGASNSTYASEGGRTYANLQSKYIVIKFAAGNIFTGEYLKTDGTNGILSFGRPFNSFPTHLQFDYRYTCKTINKGGGKWDENYGRYISRQTYDGLKGQPDTCQVFLALIGDKDEEEFQGKTYPFVIRTRPSELKLFNPNDDNVIAYTQISTGETVSDWTTVTLPIHYRHKDRTPKYIIVVASSSKYGDYFVGGDGSLLQLDNLSLQYK